MDNDTANALYDLFVIEVERISLDALIALRTRLRTSRGKDRLAAGLAVLDRVDRAERALLLRRPSDDLEHGIAYAREALSCAFAALDHLDGSRAPAEPTEASARRSSDPRDRTSTPRAAPDRFEA
jgi:hypothetical protein